MFQHYTFDTPEYVADFQTLLRCSGDQDETAFFDWLLAAYSRDAVAVDWGAGSGAVTRRLLARFQTVYAVEPNPGFRQILERSCPGARIIAGTLSDAVVPEPADVGVIRHVFYHVPDHKWGTFTLAAAGRLSPRGVLAVTLKHPETACNAMIEAFGAPRFDLTILDGVWRQHPEYQVERVVVPVPIVTSSLDDTLAIARFMLADREPDAYPRPFSEDDVREYVRHHLWDERTGTGGWRCDTLTYLIRKNPFWRPGK